MNLHEILSDDPTTLENFVHLLIHQLVSTTLEVCCRQINASNLSLARIFEEKCPSCFRWVRLYICMLYAAVYCAVHSH